jgi:hypothetical protein
MNNTLFKRSGAMVEKNSDKDLKKKSLMAFIEKRIAEHIINEKKELIKEIDDKLENLIEEEKQSIMDEMESSVNNYLDELEDKDHVNKLGSKLDDFLSGKMSFGMEAEEVKASEEQQNTQQKQKTLTDSKKANETASTEEVHKQTRDMEKDLLKLKIEKDLEALKQLVKPSGMPQKAQEEAAQVSNIEQEAPAIVHVKDKDVEKKFRDREIDDALAALKAKSQRKSQPQPDDKPADQPLDPVSDEDLNSSLNDFLKKMDK